jgi:predicted acyltransferase
VATVTGTGAEVGTQSSPNPTVQERLVSLDFFRGATIAVMILVNSPGGSVTYWPLQHAQWNGWTPTDLVFPFFLFIVGVALMFSFATRLGRGNSRRTLVLHTFRRSAVIFLIGLLLNALFNPHLATLRIPGVLQRIAVAYFAAALIALYSHTRAQVVWIVALLLGYWALMRLLPVPGYGVPGHDIRLLHPDANLAAYLDRKLMAGHLYERTRDPEGVLSTLPAIATVLCGVLTGEWLRSNRTQKRKAAWMLVFGAAGLVAGELWNVWFPINKKLWTSSYVLFTAGFALVCLAACYWTIDIKLHRGWWTRPLLIFGTNAIAAYIISEFLAGFFGWKDILFQHTFAHVTSPRLASLLYSLAIVVLCFLPVWWMYRKRIFLKV